MQETAWSCRLVAANTLSRRGQPTVGTPPSGGGGGGCFPVYYKVLTQDLRIGHIFCLMLGTIRGLLWTSSWISLWHISRGDLHRGETKPWNNNNNNNNSNNKYS
jgi:hypothetical protein